MKLNKKGFTLVELLAVIVISSLVIAGGTFLTLEIIDKSKEKAFSASKTSVLKSAQLYSGEFQKDEDWVTIQADNYDKEQTCVSVWWLINKGYEKKTSFNTNDEKSNNKYTINANDVVVLIRDSNSKAIISSELEKEVNAESCENTLHGELEEIAKTTNSITVKGNCAVKNTVPDDIEYKFCISDGKSSEICNENIKSNSHTFKNLTHNTEYSINLTCKSNEWGTTTKSENFTTNELKAPTITAKEDNQNQVTVNFFYDSNNIAKTVKVNTDKVFSYTNKNFLSKSSTENFTNRIEEFDISQIENKVEFTATNSDGTNKVETKKTLEREILENDISTPIIYASDYISSKSWHNNDFNLIISSSNTLDIVYYYRIGTSTTYQEYNNGNTINISDETANTEYRAKACLKNDVNKCSKEATYVVKLDKTAPNINVTSKTISLTQDSNGIYYNDTWQNKTIDLTFKASDNISRVEQTATFSYNAPKNSDLNKNLIGSYDINASNNSFSTNITSNGNRYLSLKVCDNAGNCTTKNVNIKIDTTPPTVNVSMNYTGGSSIPLTSNGNTSSYNNWLNKKVTLKFTTQDSLSGIKQNATFSYNAAYNAKDSSKIFGSEQVALNNNSWSRNIYSDGNRYMTLEVCDNASNCTTRIVKFKIDTEAPIVKYIGKDPNDKNYVKFQCESLSGTATFITNDSLNGRVETNENVAKHYWGQADNRPNIGITCRSNSGFYSNYTLKRIAKTTSETYGRCVATLKTDAYYNGSQTNNPCSLNEYVCGGTQRKNTNCYTNGTTKYFNGIGERPVLYYYSWSWETKVNYTTTYYEMFEFNSSGSN